MFLVNRIRTQAGRASPIGTFARNQGFFALNQAIASAEHRPSVTTGVG
jgi:hypothetical protein